MDDVRRLWGLPSLSLTVRRAFQKTGERLLANCVQEEVQTISSTNKGGFQLGNCGLEELDTFRSCIINNFIIHQCWSKGKRNISRMAMLTAGSGCSWTGWLCRRLDWRWLMVGCNTAWEAWGNSGRRLVKARPNGDNNKFRMKRCCYFVLIDYCEQIFEIKV